MTLIKYPFKLYKNKLVFYEDSNDILQEKFRLIVKRYESENYIKEENDKIEKENRKNG